jgi:hypothetical protein
MRCPEPAVQLATQAPRVPSPSAGPPASWMRPAHSSPPAPPRPREQAQPHQPTCARAVSAVPPSVAQVDDAAVDERPAVVHPHDHLASVGRVAHAHIAGQRQCLVRGRHGVHVVGLAARGRRAVELAAVPRGNARFAERPVVGDRLVGPAQHRVGLAGAAAVADGFDTGLGIGHAVEVWGNVGARSVSAAYTAAATARAARATSKKNGDRDRAGGQRRGGTGAGAVSQIPPSTAPAWLCAHWPGRAGRPASALH